MKYESNILKRLIDTYGVVGNPRYISEIIKEFIVQGKERFPNLFTYQADWLAHIDEFGLNPSYTVSYTGQSIYAPNTLEKPVKSAILTGNTLVNIKGQIVNIGVLNTQVEFNIPCVKMNTDYFIKYKTTTTSDVLAIGFLESNLKWSKNLENQPSNGAFILNSGDTPNYFRISGKNSTSTIVDELMIIEYQDGMENWDIPYFEGMQSVKMPVLTTANFLKVLGNEEIVNIYNAMGYSNVEAKLSENGKFVLTKNGMYAEPTKVWQLEPDTTYTFQATGDDVIDFPYFTNGLWVNGTNKDYSNKIFQLVGSTDSTGLFGLQIIFETNKEVDFNVFKGNYLGQVIETNDIKTNILTVNEDVTLRSNGNVYDELDLLTGKLTQRIDEDGSVLTQEVVKTVDLNILDQNGQNIKQLMSFNGGTHFITGSAEGSLLPVVSVSVETDLEETLKVCSLEGNTM